MMTVFHIFKSVLGLLLCLGALASLAAPPAPRTFSLGISQIVEHPSLNQIRLGLIEGLKKEGYADNLKITYINAQGDMVTSNQIARKLHGDRHDVLVGITTPSAQGLVATKTKTPIVFTGVNDPIGAKLVKNLEHPEGGVTGVMLVSPIKEQIALILEVVPKANSIAMIYNAGEANSVSIAAQFADEVKAQGRKPMLTTITNSSQVQAAAQSLVGRADAVYLPTDNTVISALGAILQIGAHNRLPIFAADTASVEAGALAALGLDHFAMGTETGSLIARVLRGEKIANLPVVVPRLNELHVNSKYASGMGVTLPATLLKRASKVYH